MKKFYDIEIDSQVELENGKTLGKLEESKISVNDGNCGSGGWPASGGMMVGHIIYNEDDETFSCDKTFAELSAAAPNVILEEAYETENRIYSLFSHGIGFIAFRRLHLRGHNGELDRIECDEFFITADDSLHVESYQRTFE